MNVKVLALAVFLLSGMVGAQQASNADKQKLIDMEQKFAANATAGPEAAEVVKQQLYDAEIMQLTQLGKIGALSKSRIVELSSKPDPNDPNVKTTQKISDFTVKTYGNTALVGYQLTTTDSGHKDAELNTTDEFGCLDTWIKQNGKWLVVGNACSPRKPLPAAEWKADAQAAQKAPKDVQEAYH